MAKKKEKPQVINNIQELNLEIDYDKLAEAIVKANSQLDAEANKSKTAGSCLAFVGCTDVPWSVCRRITFQERKWKQFIRYGLG